MQKPPRSKRKLQVAQRRTLRGICASARRPDEDWVDWIQRATHFAEQCLEEYGADTWVVAQRSRKWRWAGKVARMLPCRWAQLASLWEPDDGHRRVGRPCQRWSDDIQEFFALASNGFSTHKMKSPGRLVSALLKNF